MMKMSNQMKGLLKCYDKGYLNSWNFIREIKMKEIKLKETNTLLVLLVFSFCCKSAIDCVRVDLARFLSSICRFTVSFAYFDIYFIIINIVYMEKSLCKSHINNSCKCNFEIYGHNSVLYQICSFFIDNNL